ncbi:unnamed protein product, partial [Ectocarpus sp. 12 AP-2014]
RPFLIRRTYAPVVARSQGVATAPRLLAWAVLVVRGEGTTADAGGRAGWVKITATVTVAAVATTAAATVARRRRRAARARAFALAATGALATGALVATRTLVVTRNLATTGSLGAAARDSTLVVGVSARGRLVPSTSTGPPAPRSAPPPAATVLVKNGNVGLLGAAAAAAAARGAGFLVLVVIPPNGTRSAPVDIGARRRRPHPPIAVVTRWRRVVPINGTGRTPRQHLIRWRGHRC